MFGENNKRFVLTFSLMFGLTYSLAPVVRSRKFATILGVRFGNNSMVISPMLV
jgi:hypothetical protein